MNYDDIENCEFDCGTYKPISEIIEKLCSKEICGHENSLLEIPANEKNWMKLWEENQEKSQEKSGENHG